MFNATFNNISVISWRSVLLVEETGGPGENHWPVTDKLYHIMLYTSPWSRFELTTSVVINADCIGSCKSNYHTITTTMIPLRDRQNCIRWILTTHNKVIIYQVYECLSPGSYLLSFMEVKLPTEYNKQQQNLHTNEKYYHTFNISIKCITDLTILRFHIKTIFNL